jgi:hypothetical protein
VVAVSADASLQRLATVLDILSGEGDAPTLILAAWK